MTDEEAKRLLNDLVSSDTPIVDWVRASSKLSEAMLIQFFMLRCEVKDLRDEINCRLQKRSS